MTDFVEGDLVVLKSGSMRMLVEAVEDDRISCVWCHEGVIGRDQFGAILLKKWEFREDDRGPKSGGRPHGGGGGRDRDDRREGGGKPHRGDRDGGGRPYGDRNDRDDRGPKKGKPGWDGKPREKKYFRKDD